MASLRDTRVLFVPYQPGNGHTKGHANGEISQQKHAAREYHRKAKERRRTLKQVKDETNSSPSSSFSSISQSSESPDINLIRMADTSPCQTILPDTPPTPVSDGSVSLPLSPRNSLGAGRIDPMNCLPISDMSPYAQEMMDFSLTYQWTVFSFANPGSTMEDMKRHVMSRILSSATSLYAIVFAGATYYALRRPGNRVTQENLMLRLNYKTRALRNMSKEIQELGPQVPNETLYTMLSLAAFGASEKLQPPDHKDFEQPLAIAHDLDFYCRLPCEWAHLRALMHLIKQRGGLNAVSRPGFSIVLSLYDVMTSFQRLEQPAFPLLKSTKQILSSWASPEDPMPYTYTLGSGFNRLSNSTSFPKLLGIISCLTETILGWDRYQRATPDAPILHQIVRARHAVLHDLQCLPDLSLNVRAADDCLYELCRLGTMSFLLIFLYPLGQENGPHELLAKRLMVMLDIANSLSLWKSHANFMLWVSVVSGIVANESPLRHWFVEEIHNSGIKHTMVAWPPVSSVLSNYLWLESECGDEGMALWEETWAMTQSRAASV